MSIPNLTDDCKRLIDDGWGLLLYKEDGKYTAEALKKERIIDAIDLDLPQAVHLVIDKVFGPK